MYICSLNIHSSVLKNFVLYTHINLVFHSVPDYFVLSALKDIV
jgi:hypothetical protein